jgi:hypothetical protein
MAEKLQDKVAVITGGTSGIGLGIAKRFAREGARVFITGRERAKLEAAAADIGAAAVPVRADSGDLADLDRLFDRVNAEAGRIDVLVANAGGGEFQPLGAITEASFEDTFGRNVKGVLFTVQKALPLLVDGAAVILTGSNTSIRGTANMTVYAASKAAVRSFARTWTLELRDRGIRVNVLSPGPVRTPGLIGLVGPDPAAQAAFLKQFGAQVPLGRVGDPDEIGRVAVFLACEDSSFVAGIELFADGGQAQV